MACPGLTRAPLALDVDHAIWPGVSIRVLPCARGAVGLTPPLLGCIWHGQSPVLSLTYRPLSAQNKPSNARIFDYLHRAIANRQLEISHHRSVIYNTLAPPEPQDLTVDPEWGLAKLCRPSLSHSWPSGSSQTKASSSRAIGVQTQPVRRHLPRQVPFVVPAPQPLILLVLINLQIMNDFERLRRCSALDSLPSYPWGDRSMSMAVSHAMRSDPRSCPTRQTRAVPAADSDPESSNGQPRRRIAVAVSGLHQAVPIRKLTACIVRSLSQKEDSLQWRPGKRLRVPELSRRWRRH